MSHRQIAQSLGISQPTIPLCHGTPQLKRKGATLEGFLYNRFCQGYRARTDKLDLVMRQSHHAGEKFFQELLIAKGDGR